MGRNLLHVMMLLPQEIARLQASKLSDRQAACLFYRTSHHPSVGWRAGGARSFIRGAKTSSAGPTDCDLEHCEAEFAVDSSSSGEKPTTLDEGDVGDNRPSEAFNLEGRRKNKVKRALLRPAAALAR